jgi:hypothetical protein
MCMGSITVGAHVKVNAYQREWLRLSVAFNKLVKNLLAVMSVQSTLIEGFGD